MRTMSDVHRSLARFAAAALGSDWEVRMSDDGGAWKRPAVLVIPTGPLSDAGGSQFVSELVQPWAMYAYPPVGTSPDDSLLKAQVIADKVNDAVRFGVVAGVQVDKARPLRIPLYLYDGVALGTAATVRAPSDYLRVSDLAVETVQDPNSRALFTVTVELRLRWRRAPKLGVQGALIDVVPVHVSGP